MKVWEVLGRQLGGLGGLGGCGRFFQGLGRAWGQLGGRGLGLSGYRG